MINVDYDNPEELRRAGFDALINALGPVGFTKFMQQIYPGTGDYTKEKYEQPEMTPEEEKEFIRQVYEMQARRYDG